MPAPPRLPTLRPLATSVEAYLLAYCVCCLVLSAMAIDAALTM